MKEIKFDIDSSNRTQFAFVYQITANYCFIVYCGKINLSQYKNCEFQSEQTIIPHDLSVKFLIEGLNKTLDSFEKKTQQTIIYNSEFWGDVTYDYNQTCPSLSITFNQKSHCKFVFHEFATCTRFLEGLLKAYLGSVLMPLSPEIFFHLWHCIKYNNKEVSLILEACEHCQNGNYQETKLRIDKLFNLSTKVCKIQTLHFFQEHNTVFKGLLDLYLKFRVQ